MYVCQVHISERASVATVIYTIIWNRICQICYALRKLRNQNNATTSRKLFYDLHTALIDCEKNLKLFSHWIWQRILKSFFTNVNDFWTKINKTGWCCCENGHHSLWKLVNVKMIISEFVVGSGEQLNYQESDERKYEDILIWSEYHLNIYYLNLIVKEIWILNTMYFSKLLFFRSHS